MLDRTTTLVREAPTALYLTLLEDRRIIASNFRGDFAINRHNQWAWIVGHIIQWFGCNPEDVSCVETDAGDVFAVSGKPVAELVEN